MARGVPSSRGGTKQREAGSKKKRGGNGGGRSGGKDRVEVRAKINENEINYKTV